MLPVYSCCSFWPFSLVEPVSWLLKPEPTRKLFEVSDSKRLAPATHVGSKSSEMANELHRPEIEGLFESVSRGVVGLGRDF